MEQRTFLLMKEGSDKVIEKKLDIPTTWDDIKVKNYCEFMRVMRNWNSFNSDMEKAKSSDYEEMEVRNAVFMSDAIIALTGIDKFYVQTMRVSDMLEFWESLDFAVSSLPEGMEKEFFFRAGTSEQIEKSKKALKSLSITKQMKRTKLAAEIKMMEKSHFSVKENYGERTLMQHIGINRIMQEVKKIEAETKQLNFDRFPELIAYCVDMNGQSVNIQKAKELAKVFEDLPFSTAVKVANFFLGATIISSSTLGTFTKIHSYLRKVNPKR